MTIVVLLAVLAVGSSVIVYEFLIYNDNEIENISPYEKLKNYEDLKKAIQKLSKMKSNQ